MSKERQRKWPWEARFPDFSFVFNFNPNSRRIAGTPRSSLTAILRGKDRTLHGVIGKGVKQGKGFRNHPRPNTKGPPHSEERGKACVYPLSRAP